MKSRWMAFFLGGLCLCHGENPSTVSSAPGDANSTKVPVAEITDPDKYQGLQRQLDRGFQLPHAPTLEILNSNDSFQLIPQLTDEERAREDEKNSVDKDWLLKSISDSQFKDPKDPNSDSFAKFRADALKSLSNPAEKDSSRKEDLVDARKSLLETIQDPQNTSQPDKTSDTSGNRFPSLVNMPIWTPAASTSLNELSTFQPVISGFSTDSTKSLSDSAEKAYRDSVATIKPIDSFDIPLSPSFSSASFTTISTSSSPLSSPNGFINPLSGAALNPSAPTVSNQVSLPSISSMTTETLTPTPVLPQAPIAPVVEPYRSPAATSSVYNPKVADPNDYLRH